PESPGVSESQLKTFKRLRSSFEQSVRAATSRSRSKTPQHLTDELGVRQSQPQQQQQRSPPPSSSQQQQSQGTEDRSVFRRLESKVAPFRRARKESTPPTVSPSSATAAIAVAAAASATAAAASV